MLILFRLELFALPALVLYKAGVLVLRYARRSNRRLMCGTCRYCGMIDRDGGMPIQGG